MLRSSLLELEYFAYLSGQMGNRATDDECYRIIVKWSSIRVMAMGHDFGYACRSLPHYTQSLALIFNILSSHCVRPCHSSHPGGG